MNREDNDIAGKENGTKTRHRAGLSVCWNTAKSRAGRVEEKHAKIC